MVQFNPEELKDCQKRVEDLEKQNGGLEKENSELKDRMRSPEFVRRISCWVSGIESNISKEMFLCNFNCIFKCNY